MIELCNICKTFGDVQALDNVSFTIGPGSIFGMIGPNGAGKTTCLNIISTLLKPSGGTVVIDGLRADLDVRKVRRSIGYMPDFFGTYHNLSVEEYLNFYGGACGVEFPVLGKRVGEVLELANLTDKRYVLVDNLSRGMKQRLCLAKTLIHKPKVLILDEPASGLDPRARVEIREILTRAADVHNTTVVISSHILSELNNLCTHIGIIEQGKLLRDGQLDEILRTISPKRSWKIHFCGDPSLVKTQLGTLRCVESAEVNGQTAIIRLDENHDRDNTQHADAFPLEIIEALAAVQAGLCGLIPVKADLEEAFMSFTQGLLA